MSQEDLLRRVEHLERSVRWRTRLLAALGAIAILGAASASQPTSLVIGKEGGPLVTIENGVLELTDQNGNRATFAAHELELRANERSTLLDAIGLKVQTEKPDYWNASKVSVSTQGLSLESPDAYTTSVGRFSVHLGGGGASLGLGVTPEGAQSPVGGAWLQLEAGPKSKGGVIRLDASQGKAPVLSVAPSHTSQSVTLSTDGKLGRSPAR